MSQRCDQCRSRIRGTPHRTYTGRILCERCNDRLTGATAGAIMGGGLPNMISTAGWYQRAKRAMRPRSRG